MWVGDGATAAAGPASVLRVSAISRPPQDQIPPDESFLPTDEKSSAAVAHRQPCASTPAPRTDPSDRCGGRGRAGELTRPSPAAADPERPFRYAVSARRKF